MKKYLCESSYFRVTLMPPFDVRTRIGAPPDPSCTDRSRSRVDPGTPG